MKSITLLLSVIVCASLLSACGKKGEESTGAVTARPEKKAKKPKAEDSAAAPAAPAAETSAPAQPERPVMTHLEALNLVVDQFGGYYGRPPYKLEELVEKRLLPRLPEPTPGKRFDLVTDKKTRSAHVVEVPN